MALARASSAPDLRNRALRLLAGLGIVVGTLTTPLSAQLEDATRTFHRPLTVYYGTWTVFMQGSATPLTTETFVELSDDVSFGLGSRIENDPSVDVRVRSAAQSWVFPGLTNIEWVLNPPGNLPATDNFNAAIAALGGSITTDSGFLTPVQKTYWLDRFDTTETAPVLVGDPFDVLFGADGQVVTIANNFVADVSYVERNGSVTLSSVGKCPLSHGYWKNNLSLWTVPSLTLGTLTYPKSALAAILGAPSTKDASIILGRQLIAAKLNVLYGADPAPVALAIGDADALIGSSLVPSGVTPSSALGRLMTARASTLADFNNGQLTTICTP